MPNFLPLAVQFPGGKPIFISNVAEAAATMSNKWPDPTSAVFVRAADLLAKAMAGSCRPTVALEAYRIAVGHQGLLLRGGSRSPALQIFDSVCNDISRFPVRRRQEA